MRCPGRLSGYNQPMTKAERINLAIFAAIYLIAWILLTPRWDLLQVEVGQLVASCPFLFCVVVLISAPEKK